MKRVFLTGDLFGSYRSRVLMEYLTSSSDYSISYMDPKYFLPKKHTFFRRIVSKLIFTAYSIFNNLMIIPADLVFVLPMGNISKLQKLTINLFKKQLVAEFYVSKFDTYVNDRKVVKSNSYTAKKLLKNDQRLFDIAEHIIFLNIPEKNYYSSIIHRFNVIKNYSIIPLCTQTREKAVLPFINGKRDYPILCWWGTYIPLHGIEIIIKAANELLSAGLFFKLYLFGTSDEKSKPYQELIDRYKLNKHVTIDNSLHFSDGSLDRFLIKECDLAFGNFGDSEKAKTVMVNKVVEAASMGIPVISQRTAALDQYFKNGESIIFVNADQAEIGKVIGTYINEKEKLTVIGNNSQKVFATNFSKKRYLEKIIPIIADAVNK